MRGLSGNRGKVLVAVVGVGLSALFLWLAVRNADLDAVRHALADARLGFVLLAVLALGLGYGFQAARWQRIADAPGLRLGSFYGMLLGSLACNNVLPVRIGELLRAGWLSRDAPMPGGRAFGSVVLDRICDVVTLTVFFAIGLQAVASAEWLVRLAVGAVLAVVVIAVALVLARVYSSRRGRRAERRPRGRLVQILRDTIEMLGEPIGRRRAATWLGLTVCTWTLSSVAAALVARSLGIDLSPLEAVFVTSALALGVAIPSSPGTSGRTSGSACQHSGCSTSPSSRRSRSRFSCRRAGTCRRRSSGGAFVGHASCAAGPFTRQSRARLKATTWKADTLRDVISVVVPLLNEERTLETLYAEIAAALEPQGDEFEVIFVDDGSSDGSMSVLTRLHDELPNVVVVHLRRNFGKAAALQAGFLEARGDVDRDHRRRPPRRPGRDPEAPRQARRGLRPRLGLEDASQRPAPQAAVLPRLQLGDGRRLRHPPARRELRPEGVPRRGAAGHAPLRGAPPLHPDPRRIPRLPRRGDPRQPPPAPARPLAVRARALPPRLLRPPERHVHGPLPPSAPRTCSAASARSWEPSGSSS